MRKIILTVAVVAMLVCIFAISVSAATVYKNADGEELFSYVDENNDYIFDSYVGSFPKTDEQGNELTWYITKTTTENGNTVHTVACLKTLGEAGNIDDSGVFTYTSPVTNKNTVSVNFPDNKGIKKIPMFGSYGTRKQNNILFAYLPNTLTEFPESLFQETPVLIAEIDDETPTTYVPHKLFHEARNIKVINIPASVEIIYSQNEKMGAPFCYTYSLKTVTFAPNSKLTRIDQFAFYDSNIEEIQFPDSLVAVNQNLFRSCDNLKVIRFGTGFKYFENVDNNGNATTNHHSLTHTANGIQEVYIPASFYQEKPGVNYRVSYAFDGCSNAKFFFVGTREQLDLSIANFINSEWTTGATDHNYIVTAYNENKIVTWAEYKENPDNYQGRYIIVDYNKCDAFYESVHLDDTNPCVINCDRCKAYGVAKENPVHNIATTIKYVSFDKAGTKTIGCINEGCTHGTSENAPALFVSLGYSVSEDGNGEVAIGYIVNKEAVKEYKEITKQTVKYGVFIALKDVIGDGFVFKQDGTASNGVLNVPILNNMFSTFELKISGFVDENKDIEFAMGAYVITEGEEIKYSYLQDGTPLENEKYYFVSYNGMVKSNKN